MYIIDPFKCYAIGGGAIVYSAISYSRKKQRLKSWLRTKGTVQNVRRTNQGEATVTFRFPDATGEQRTVSVLVADGDMIGLGNELELSYNPSNPTEAFVSDSKDMNLAFYIPLGAGAILIGLGIASAITLARAGL